MPIGCLYVHWYIPTSFICFAVHPYSAVMSGMFELPRICVNSDLSRDSSMLDVCSDMPNDMYCKVTQGGVLPVTVL